MKLGSDQCPFIPSPRHAVRAKQTRAQMFVVGNEHLVAITMCCSTRPGDYTRKVELGIWQVI
jgi:hypothetical protein